MDVASLPPLFQDALEGYKLDYMAARNLAAKTRVDYETDIVQFLAYLTRIYQTNFETLAPKHIRAYLAKLDRLRLAGSSRRRKFIVVCSFCRWLKEAGYIVNNPALQVEAPQIVEKEPRVLTREEYWRVLMLAKKPRDRAIIQLVLQTGIKLAEIHRLNLSDLLLPERAARDSLGAMHIWGKGRKDRTLVLNAKVCAALLTWLRIRPSVETNAVFVSRKRQRVSARQIENIVCKYLAQAGIEQANVHTLRHTMATHHHAMGTDIGTLNGVLGHEKMMTTAVYIPLAQKQQAYYMQKNAL